jgi:hypothetical protein
MKVALFILIPYSFCTSRTGAQVAVRGEGSPGDATPLVSAGRAAVLRGNWRGK